MKLVMLGALVTAFCLQGCTLLGAGIGAAIDSAIPGPYEDRGSEHIEVRRGQNVIIGTRRGVRIAGRYVGTLGPTPESPELYLAVDAESGLTQVATSDVADIRVEVTGRGWLYGGIVGLAVDAALVVAVIVAMSDFYSKPLWSGSGGGW